MAATRRREPVWCLPAEMPRLRLMPKYADAGDKAAVHAPIGGWRPASLLEHLKDVTLCGRQLGARTFANGKPYIIVRTDLGEVYAGDVTLAREYREGRAEKPLFGARRRPRRR